MQPTTSKPSYSSSDRVFPAQLSFPSSSLVGSTSLQSSRDHDLNSRFPSSAASCQSSPSRQQQQQQQEPMLHKAAASAKSALAYSDNELVAMFERLDVSKSGKLDNRDLSMALATRFVPASRANVDALSAHMYAHRGRMERLRNSIRWDHGSQLDWRAWTLEQQQNEENERVASVAKNADDGTAAEQQQNGIDFETFCAFVRRREEELYGVFVTLDSNHDGQVTYGDLVLAMDRLGIPNVSEDDIRALIRHVDSDRDGAIDYREFVDFCLLLPHVESPEAVFSQWFSSAQAVIDFSSDISSMMPMEILAPGQQRIRGLHVAEKSQQRIMYADALKVLCAGAVAGAVSRTVTAPLDRLKILLQANAFPVPKHIPQNYVSEIMQPATVTGATATPSSALTSARAPQPSRRKIGVAQGLRMIYQEGGFRAFFRGNGTNVTKIIPESAIKFFVYEHVKSMFVHAHNVRNSAVFLETSYPRPYSTKPSALQNQHGSYGLQSTYDAKQASSLSSISMLERFTSGAVAGLTAQVAIYPFEVIKTRLAVEPIHTSIAACAKHVVRQGGIGGLYRGLAASCVGVVPYCGIDLSVYSFLKDTWSSVNPGKEPTVPVLLGCGMVSSSIAQTVAYPLAVAKTRLQLQVHRQSLMSCLSGIVEKEGVRGLYGGMMVNMMKVVPAVSISYVVYEMTKTLL
ncbi:mitochondrial solute carrier family 25 (mitochondrial phosphate transporter) member 23/24/25/41 [Andalucia godoyi]|uniref:Mitochondrial solute carrier family 25 (Mitochondrial phosphate transporter) member 23/24/25/41 n=1 Tax=Andalucia godoyi TaxID=505711 RepID=A0A8K0F454_ANDGO|nr:mitochondrial solute carrier family 25 (mitochondrial phosphate transporter) member 23/24/25/41 [Andalucia godoyi]|eukprot:ANDGO_00120.mRNA.1 mitochondrial solute carrier family 25 (mitochondrial phosphate transporter) member 23/24/25/41